MPRHRHIATLLPVLLAALVASPSGHPTAAAAPADRHSLTVRLVPATRTLEGESRIRLIPDRRTNPVLALAPRAAVRTVCVDGRPAAYRFASGLLHIDPGPASAGRAVELHIAYTARFDDPYPDTPLNTDNPGYGVTGIVGPEGTFLLGGSRWYPRRPGVPATVDLTVIAPIGTVAVTAGVWQGVGTENGRSVTRWQADGYGEPLALSAGPYHVTERQVGAVRLATYFTDATGHLAEAYLDATERYLGRYQRLFGPYPYPQFAVVENFFPTGYGFPSYTLIGGRVLRLPFILHTSLPHEMVHCWWGNAVGVDLREGNWAEGLATYTADYLAKERRSPEAARDHRRQMLRNYAALVPRPKAMPLSAFSHRFDPASKAIGYDKGAMVFHMLRRQVGDDAFWSALQDLYREKRFQTASWSDFREAFQRNAPGTDLTVFFDEWLYRADAPRLSFSEVKRRRTEKGWRIEGAVVQPSPAYQMDASLALETDAGDQHHRLPINGHRTRFVFETKDTPRRLVFDPGFHLMRRLAPSEIPPTVNRLRGASRARLVLAEGTGKAGRRTARVLGAALGLADRRLVAEAELDPAEAADHDLIVVGWPSRTLLQPRVPAPVALAAEGFTLADTVGNQPGDVFFGVFERAAATGRVTALLYPAERASSPVVARKVAHYGRYSYLAFRDGHNSAKGTWPVTASPLIVTWPDGANAHGKEDAHEH